MPCFWSASAWARRDEGVGALGPIVVSGGAREPTRYRVAGDRFLLLEFGRRMTLELNFLAQGVARAVRERDLAGVVDLAPCFASLLVEYDPDRIDRRDLESELQVIEGGVGGCDDLQLDSRLFLIPVLYLDPWTRECIEQYARTIQVRGWDPELLAREHGLSSAEEFARLHASTDWWVAAIGSWPGLPFCMALDPRVRISAAKYSPPRTSTPRGAIGLGGGSTAIYSVESPGGYQIFGRTPAPIYEPEQRLAAFADGPVLLRAGDRLRFLPIDRDEFDRITARVADGSYVHERADSDQFSLTTYRGWCRDVLAPGRG